MGSIEAWNIALNNSQSVPNDSSGDLLQYTIDISTSTKSSAGTNDWVYLTITGSNGSTDERGLDLPDKNDMMLVIKVFLILTTLFVFDINWA